MKRHRHGDAAIGAGERGLRIAIGEFAHRDFVGLGFGMNERRGACASCDRIDHRFERRIVDLHKLGGILGDIAALRHHQRHRLADIAHPLHRQRPLIDRRFHRGEERIGELSDLVAGDDGPDAVMRQRARHIDAKDLGMRVRRAHDMSVQGADRDRQVVGITAAAQQQRRVLLAQHRFAELLGHDFALLPPSSVYMRRRMLSASLALSMRLNYIASFRGRDPE